MARTKKLPRTKRGEGSFRYNASGTLEYRFSYRDENWQAKRKSVTGADEQECYDRAQEFLDKMDKVHRGIDVNMTMIDILKEHYDADYAMNFVGEPGYARNLNSLVALQKHPIGSIPIKDLEKEDVMEYLYTLTRYSNSVIGKLFRQVRLAFSLAQERKIIEDNIMLSMKTEEFDDVINTNLRGTYLCMKKALKPMLKQKYGRIISLSSVVGLRGNVGQANYSASKAGIIGLTKSLAKEMAARNITVNAVAPGFIGTDMTDAMTDAAKEKMIAEIPCKRIGEPEDVANAVSFFASPDASYITGQVLCVDGGMAV